MSFDIDVFYSKLLKNTNNSGRMRWNAICEDIINMYLHNIPENSRLINRDRLWDILFNPYEKSDIKKKDLEVLFKNKEHLIFFKDIVYIAIDDPINWDKWVSRFMY